MTNRKSPPLLFKRGAQWNVNNTPLSYMFARHGITQKCCILNDATAHADTIGMSNATVLNTCTFFHVSFYIFAPFYLAFKLQLDTIQSYLRICYLLR